MLKEKQYTYSVMLDWSTDDCSDIEFMLFSTYKKALKHFKKLIKDECNPKTSWVGLQALNDNGEVNDGYELNCYLDNANDSDLCWNVQDKYDYNYHTFIYLTKKEIN